MQPLTYAWGHPSIIEEIKPRTFLIQPDVCCSHFMAWKDFLNIYSLKKAYPALYNWTTFPLTSLIERVWTVGCEYSSSQRNVEPTTLEFCSCLERALNFMHTGNVSVIATSVMNPLWIGLSVIHDGHPCINSHIVPSLTATEFVNPSRWPTNAKGQPASASRCSQIRTYGESHFNVCNIFPES